MVIFQLLVSLSLMLQIKKQPGKQTAAEVFLSEMTDILQKASLLTVGVRPKQAGAFFFKVNQHSFFMAHTIMLHYIFNSIADMQLMLDV